MAGASKASGAPIWPAEPRLNEDKTHATSDEPGWWGDGRDQNLFPESEEQARSHIEWIRKSRNLENPDANARALHAVLKQTAGRLYSDSTHFLLGLVQNADDNHYQDNVVPSMTFTYQHGDNSTGGTLRVDSNENGFSSANIQSICGRGAGESTKGHIGGKGVGFKAVFDVAHAVWINSGHYQFKFINDNDEILGLITPRWAAFPQSRLAGHTSILMELLPDYNPRRLIDALKSLDPSLLLFLKRLLEVKVHVRELNRSPWTTRFRYDGPGPRKVGMSTASIHHGQTTTSYYAYGKALSEKDLAPDERRKGATSSHMQIVFPFQGLYAGDNPDPPTQSLFAILPVRDYGLKLIVQADFLLATSRKSVDECPWNEALIANIPEMFVEAVTELNKLGKTYMWLPFAPLGPYQDRLLATLPAQTIARLSGSPVLESSLGVQPGEGDAAPEVKTKPETAATPQSNMKPPLEVEPEKIESIEPEDFKSETTESSVLLQSKDKPTSSEVETKEPDKPVTPETKSETIDKPASERVKPQTIDKPTPEKVKVKDTGDPASEKTEQVKPKKVEGGTEPGRAPAIQSEREASLDVKSEKIASPERKEIKSEKADKPAPEVKPPKIEQPATEKGEEVRSKKTETLASKAPPVASDVVSDSTRDASDLSEPAVKARPKANDGGVQGTDRPIESHSNLHHPSRAAVHKEYVIETRRDQSAIYHGFDLKQGEIRVIKLNLLRGADGAVESGSLDSRPLSGSFEVVSRDQPPPYCAISYVWGPPPSGPNVNTFRTAQGDIPITESLTACLKCLRRKGIETFIWVDALCINQSDSEEKEIQIPSIGTVYTKSERVIIWMGETGLHDERSPGIDWLKSAHTPTCKTAGHCDMATNPGPGFHGWEDQWSDVLSILRQEWFVRTWIIQELVLGKKISIVYGQSEIGWECFMASLFRGGDDILKEATPAIALHLTRQRHRSGLRFRFLDLLELFSYTQATEPRDKLFAHLSMAYDVEQPIFNQDYHSREEIVLEKYARGLVDNESALDLLRWAGSGKSAEFCSWIPNFLQHRFARTISTWEGGKNGFYAGKSRPAAAKVKTLTKHSKRELKKDRPDAHPPAVLEVAGYIIGTVDLCCPLQMGNADHEITFSKAYACIREYAAAIKNSYKFPSGRDATSDPYAVDKILLRTLIGDARGPRTKSDWAVRFGDPTTSTEPDTLWPTGFERTILQLELSEDRHQSLNKSAESRGLMTAYWQTAAAFTRRIPEAAFVTVLPVRTAEQPLYVGIAPGKAAAGDVVFVANNAKVPLVLRRQGDQPFYVLVGECYLDGIMYAPPPWVETAREELMWIL